MIKTLNLCIYNLKLAENNTGIRTNTIQSHPSFCALRQEAEFGRDPSWGNTSWTTYYIGHADLKLGATILLACHLYYRHSGQQALCKHWPSLSLFCPFLLAVPYLRSLSGSFVAFFTVDGPGAETMSFK